MTQQSYSMDRTSHDELVTLIEDSVSYFCDENMVSGELSWIIIECLAKSKIHEMKQTQ